MKLRDEQFIHLAFQISLWVKCLLAIVEIIGGIAAFFVTQQFLVEVAILLTQGELAEDPHDLVANYLLKSVRHLSISTQHFTGLYLLSHGIVKLWLIIGLLRERLWYYPLSIVAFGLFIVYQLYRFDSTHSIWLLVITALDVFVIGLTWHEYRYLRRKLA